MYFEIILLFSGAVCTYAQTSRVRQFEFNYACFESGEVLLSLTMDGDELFYIDYMKETAVWATTRIQSAVSQLDPDKFGFTTGLKAECPSTMKKPEFLYNKDKGPEAKEAPDTMMIYTKDEVINGMENTLICFVNHFYPPAIKMKWTKNDVVVAVEDRIISYLPNPDGKTYRHISTLTFTPQEGDVYACTVEHEALKEPQSRFWEADITEIDHWSSSAVFCGVGLTLGLLGITTGTFLLVKAKPTEYFPVNLSATVGAWECVGHAPLSAKCLNCKLTIADDGEVI